MVFAAPAILATVFATICVTSSTPPTPPAPSAAENSETFFKGLKEVICPFDFFVVTVRGVLRIMKMVLSKEHH